MCMCNILNMTNEKLNMQLSISLWVYTLLDTYLHALDMGKALDRKH